MKLSFFSFTALSLLLSMSALAIDSDAHRSLSLSARALPEGTRPEAQPEPEGRPGLDLPRPQPIPLPENTWSVKGLKTALGGLHRPQWVSQWKETRAAERDAARRLVGVRPGYRGDPTQLMETDEKGLPTGRLIMLTSKDIGELKEVPGTGGTVFALGNFKVMTVDTDPNTKEKTLAWPYTTKFVSSYDAITQNLQGILVRQNEKAQAQLPPEKRADVLGQISNGSGQPSDPQNSAATFQSYFALLHSTQAATGALIAPILNNLTSESNSTLVHQMALSIYYDITGSTTQLIGPWNNGMSFLSNDTTSNNITNSEVGAQITKIYTSMWTQAIIAANSSGLWDQQVFLTQSLYTNDTSVVPAGFMDANNTSAQ